MLRNTDGKAKDPMHSLKALKSHKPITKFDFFKSVFILEISVAPTQTATSLIFAALGGDRKKKKK